MKRAIIFIACAFLAVALQAQAQADKATPANRDRTDFSVSLFKTTANRDDRTVTVTLNEINSRSTAPTTQAAEPQNRGTPNLAAITNVELIPNTDANNRKFTVRFNADSITVTVEEKRGVNAANIDNVKLGSVALRVTGTTPAQATQTGKVKLSIRRPRNL